MVAFRLAVLIVLLAAPAADAALVERPFEPVPGAAVAACLRATGAPDGLALFGPFTEHRSATDLITAGSDGTARTARVQIGALVNCAATATAASGAAVVAGTVEAGDSGTEVRAVARDAGGRFGTRAAFRSGGAVPPPVAAAVSPDGHALVAWAQRRGDVAAEHPSHRIVAARRLPGGAFGPLEALTPWRRGGEYSEPLVTAAMDAAGVATVAWALPMPDRRRSLAFARSVVEAAQAAPGAPFAVQRIATDVVEISRPALAVAPGGWALLAYDEVGGLRVVERLPGAARFTDAFNDRPPPDRPSEFDMPVVAVRDGGGGLVAWRSSGNALNAGVAARVRSDGGPFGPLRTVAPATRPRESSSLVAVAFADDGSPFDSGNGALRAALAPDGRVLLAWTAGRHGLLVTRAAAGTLDAGFGVPARLGSPVRDVNGVAPLFLSDGRAALAWTDNAGRFGYGVPTDRGRLHLAVESAPALAEPAAPRLRLTASRIQHLFDSQPVQVRATCDDACDVRAVMSSGRGDLAAITRSVARAGTVRMWLPVDDVEGAPPRQRRVRVRARASAPGGRKVTTTSLRVLIVRRPPLPVPAPLDVRAVRQGKSILVSWRTGSPARRAIYTVIGQRGRLLTVESIRDPGTFRSVEGRGRTRFTLRLRPRRPGAVHWVAVYSGTRDQIATPRRVLVRVD